MQSYRTKTNLTAAQQAVIDARAKLETSRAELAVLKQKLVEYDVLQIQLRSAVETSAIKLNGLINDGKLPTQFRLRHCNPTMPDVEPFVAASNNYMARLQALEVDEASIPGQYKCSITHEAMPEEPVVLTAFGGSVGKIYEKDALMQYYLSKSQGYFNRGKIFWKEIDRDIHVDEITTSPTLKATFNTFVTYHEIKSYLEKKEEIRVARLAENHSAEINTLYAADSNTALEYCSVPTEPVPARYLSPQLPIDNDKSARVVMTFPVTIDGNNPDEKITICFEELMRYQNSIIPEITAEQKALLEREKEKRRQDARELHRKVTARLGNEQSYIATVMEIKDLDERVAALKAAPDERAQRIQSAAVTLAQQLQQIDKLTYKDITDKGVSELMNPFTGQPVKSIEINTQLLEEIDMYITGYMVPEMKEEQDRQLACVHTLDQYPQRETLCITIRESEKQCVAEQEELQAAIFNENLEKMGKTVDGINAKAQSGVNGYRYLYPDKSYIEVLKEAGVHEAPAAIVGMVPDNKGQVAFDVMMHPIKLDSGHVIDYKMLLEFWKPQSAFLGLFGGRADRTGMNPYVPNQKIVSMTYDHETKHVIEKFMQEVNDGIKDENKKIFVQVKSVVIIKNDSTWGWGSILGTPGFNRRGK